MTAVSWTVLVAVSTAALVSHLVVRLIERHADRLGLVDIPNERSSHVHPRPRGGGLGVMAGMAAGLAVASLGGLRLATSGEIVLAATLALALVGLVDDLRQLAVAPRLAAQTIVAAALVWAVGGFDHLPLPAPLDVPLGWAGRPLAVLWLVGVTNFFNFMDGADGLAGGQAAITLAVLAWALAPAPAFLIAATGLAATLAFLARNWAPARIFLGDVGSSWLGFLLAALPFAGPIPRREDLVLLTGTSVALFVLDPVLTLIRRTLRGAPIGAAHREHAYQRLFSPGEPHARVVAVLLLGVASLSILAAAAYTRPRLWWMAIAIVAAVFAIEWRVAAARGARSGRGARRVTKAT
jgi:Fuc2NAc and GlcNAc transferase